MSPPSQTPCPGSDVVCLCLLIDHGSSRPLQANQLGVYRAFVDNYKVAVETADKCCQANVQFAEISEVCVLPRSQSGDGLEGWLFGDVGAG